MKHGLRVAGRRAAAVIFDMDGLLLDTERIALAAFQHACAQFGLGDETAVFVRCIGTNSASGRQVLEQGLAGKADHAAFARCWDERYVEMTSAPPIPLKTGAAELLERLASLSVPLAIATSTAAARARSKLGHAGIVRFFDAIVGGDGVERSKPHPDIYLHAAAALAVEPAACLALEDSDNGVRAATAAGMFVIQVPDLAPVSPEVAALGHLRLATLHDVLSRIDGDA